MEDKLNFAKEHKKLTELNNDAIPLKFKILSSDHMDVNIKAVAYKKLDNLGNMTTSNGEYPKLKNWIHSLCDIPFGKYKELPIKYEEGQDKIIKFMKKTQADFDEKIYGHKDAKDQIIRIIAQWISNPTSKGNVIGIHGKPGVGKTTLIKDGLAKALDLPFAFVPLGGTHDSSFLDGHGYTYEGSTWGKIAELLMQSKYMNPIIYFDELDKISDTTKGQEIINVLIHLTDPSQNDKFNDKYFSEIPLDLSKALIIFTYNDDSMVSPILKDRMIRIETHDYSTMDKIEISRSHLIPDILKQFNIKSDDIYFNDESIKNVVNNTDSEAGVRNLKRNFESIISNINLNVLLGNDIYPVKVNEEIVKKYCKTKKTDINPSLPHMYL
jgi:ATP-dependent Lon protease